MLSSSAAKADIAAAYRLGAKGFLVKPPEANQLLAMVKAIKDFWLTQNTPPPVSHVQQAAAAGFKYAPQFWM